MKILILVLGLSTTAFANDIASVSLDIKASTYLELPQEQQYEFVHGLHEDTLLQTKMSPPKNAWYLSCAGESKTGERVAIFNEWLENTTASKDLSSQKLYLIAVKEDCRGRLNYKVLF